MDELAEYLRSVYSLGSRETATEAPKITAIVMLSFIVVSYYHRFDPLSFVFKLGVTQVIAHHSCLRALVALLLHLAPNYRQCD